MFNLFLAFLSVNSLLLLWFYSPLKITLAKLLFKEDITSQEQFEDLLYIKFKNNNLTILSSCYICLSFWLSLISGIILFLLAGMPYYTPVITFLSFPCLCYVFKKFIFE